MVGSWMVTGVFLLLKDVKSPFLLGAQSQIPMKKSGGQADSVGPNLYALGCSFPRNSDRDPEA